MKQNMRMNRRMEWKQIIREGKKYDTEHEEEQKDGIEAIQKESEEKYRT